MKDFRKLAVWTKAHALALAAYCDTTRFPAEERYGLTSQLRRACVSIPTNIAEGCGRNTDAELNRFLEIAMGSASETEYLFLLAHDLKYLDDSAFHKLTLEITEIKRMLASFIGKIKADRRKLRADR
ncbi:MAG: four helix bundle protein [Verrucomicrobiae bacterium]|nr:four helix bundle protein [Verrucomicrobiae bacterium]